MSDPAHESSIGDSGPFTGSGPHTVDGRLFARAADRFTFGALFVIKDASTKQVLYVARVDVHKVDDTTVILGNFQESYADPGWARIENTVDLLGVTIFQSYTYRVAATASIVNSGLVGHVTIPAGQPDVEISFVLDGFYT